MSSVMSGTANGKMNDGFFDIKYQENGVYLTVYPPVGNAKKVDPRNIIEKLTKKQVKNFNKDLVEYTAVKADKIPVLIAPEQEEIKIDATASIMVSPDKLKAYITLTPPDGGKPVSFNKLLELLNNSMVIHGINKTTLESIAKYPVYSEMILVAEATMPVNGQNGKVEFHFDTSKDRKPTILEDGRVDFRELNIIENVIRGQKLCSLIPPLPGTPGKTVVGGTIPAIDGKPAVLPRGRNVEIVDDGQVLVSSMDGQVNYIDGKVNVFSTYEVPSDVDNSTGNISFVGNVTVRGNVLSGFSIEAGGNVEVWGVVEGAVIKSGGDIILKRGMQGLGKGQLISNGDIIARYIEHSIIEAKNNIKAEAIMHSSIKCGNKLELSGRKGLLIGGTCKVGREIAAKVIGSYMATVTDIEVGTDPTVRERYKAVRDELASIDNDIKKAEQAITILKKLEAAGMMTPEKQEMLTKSIRTKIYLSSRINELKDEMNNLETKVQQEAYGKIRAYNNIYPGAKIAIGTSMIYVKENLQYCTLYRDGADIRVGAIDI